MVRSGAALLEYLNVPAGPLCDTREHVQKILARDVPRTTARDQDSTALQGQHTHQVESVIGRQCIIEAGAAAGELGRVENDRAESFSRGNKLVERLKGFAR